MGGDKFNFLIFVSMDKIKARVNNPVVNGKKLLLSEQEFRRYIALRDEGPYNMNDVINCSKAIHLNQREYMDILDRFDDYIQGYGEYPSSKS